MESKNLTAFQRPGAQAFREAVRRAPRLEAVILAESHGISIELSDGRRCYWATEHCQFKRDIIGAERTLRAAGLHSHEDVVLPAVLIAQKAAILDAARRGLITERTASEHVAAVDEKLLAASAGEHATEHDA